MYILLQRLLFGIALVFSIPAWSYSHDTKDNTWILVETDTLTLKVMQGHNTVKVFDHIALGSGGVGIERKRGDNKTPLGEFRVGWVNPKSKFHLFFGLDYPSPAHAQRALNRNLINSGTYHAIQTASLEGSRPPQNTPLGGNIGIHGIGNGDPWIHRHFNWTSGCVALTNEQIDELANWIDVGTWVVIQ